MFSVDGWNESTDDAKTTSSSNAFQIQILAMAAGNAWVTIDAFEYDTTRTLTAADWSMR